jgi:hypothetical protein
VRKRIRLQRQPRPLSQRGAPMPLAPAASCGTTNLTLGQPATMSSTGNASFPSPAAVDGRMGTGWSSVFSDRRWPQAAVSATVTARDLAREDTTANAWIATAVRDSTHRPLRGAGRTSWKGRP